MPVHKVQKRNGAIVDFNLQKILDALEKASNHHDVSLKKDVIDLLIDSIYKRIEKSFLDEIPNTTDIQIIVEDELRRAELDELRKIYKEYRDNKPQKKKRDVTVEVRKTIDEYLAKADWRVNANSNQGYSLGGMILNTAGKVTANYWLSHVYRKEIGDTHRNADYHIHDLDMFSGYCAGWSLRALLEEGFNGVSNKVESNAPKHLSSAVSQMVNFLGTLQNEWAGAQAFSSFDTYLSPYVKKYELEIRDEIENNEIKFNDEETKNIYIDNRVYQYVLQNMQSFVFNLNIPSRWGTQTPFTNITLDWTCPTDLIDKRLMLGGKLYEYSFDQLDKERGIINQAFIEVMTKGDAKGRTFTFPIPTYNITKDFNWEDKNTESLFAMTAKYGTPYFQNFINSELDPGDVRSMCCRLQLDLKELKKRGGGLFGSAEMTGSIGVVTVNAARIGYTHKGDKQAMLERIGYLMDLARESLELKRTVIQEWIDNGLFPYTKRYLGTLRNHFSTIGVNGVNEAILNFTDGEHNITSTYGQALAEDILDYMREKLMKYQEETGNLYNLEATPAEGTTYRFAKEDKKKFPEILQAGSHEAPYYTNSSQLPVGFTDDVFEALELQDKLQTKYTGGTVLHCYMNERISSPQVCAKLVKNILTNFKLPYITITPTFSICPKHGYLDGEHDFCPKCDIEIGLTESTTLDLDWREKYVNKSK